MSKRFHNKLLTGDCYMEKPFHSKFGANILKKFGWTEGSGLGKEGHGTVDCIQIKKRAENLGIGADSNAPGGMKEWNNWWDDMYNDVAKEITQHKDDTETNESDEEVSKTNSSSDVCILDICEGRTCRKGDKQIGKLKRIRQQDEAIMKKRRKKSDTVEQQDAVSNDNSLLSSVKSSISVKVKLVSDSDKAKYSCSRASQSETSTAVAAAILLTTSSKEKRKPRKKPEYT